jgi:hypothetical protein
MSPYPERSLGQAGPLGNLLNRRQVIAVQRGVSLFGRNEGP